MKQKDVIMIIMVVGISGMFSFILSRYIFAKPQDKKQSAEIVEKIVTDFTQPDTKYFNSNSINPTYQITIGNNNSQPFNPGR